MVSQLNGKSATIPNFQTSSKILQMAEQAPELKLAQEREPQESHIPVGEFK